MKGSGQIEGDQIKQMKIGSRQSKEIGEREQSTSKQTCTDQRKCQGVQHKGWRKRNTEKALQRNAVVV